MSFSEGFTQGFNMVDGALQKRNANALEQEKQVREEAHYNDALTRQGAQDAQALKWHDDASGLAAAATKYSQGRDTADDAFKKTGQDDARKHNEDMVGLQKQSNSIHAMTVRSNMAQDQSAIALNNFKLKTAKEETEKDQAVERAQTYMHSNGDGTMAITLPKGQEKAALNDFNVGFKINTSNIAANIDQHQSDVAILKSAMANEAVAFSKQNMPTVLASLNRVEAVDINNGLGMQKIDGEMTHVTKKEVVGIHDINGDGNLTFEVKSFGTRKDAQGKEVPWEDKPDSTGHYAPMTQFRSADPNDNKLTTVNRQQFFHRLEGQDAIGKIFKANPQFSQQVADYQARTHKKDGENWKTVTGPNSEKILVNIVTGKTITGESALANEELQNFNATKTKTESPATNVGLKAAAIPATIESPPLSRDQAIANQNQTYKSNAENRKAGLRSLFLTPEEIAKQDSLNK